MENAERSLNDAVNLVPRFDQAVLLLSELKIRKGHSAAAVDLLVPLTKERPQIAQAQYLLASAYWAQQKSDQAAAVYRQMTELFPKDPQLLRRQLLPNAAIAASRVALYLSRLDGVGVHVRHEQSYCIRSWKCRRA